MNTCDTFIKKIEFSLKDPCTCSDLVNVGIYRSPQAARYARQVGSSPPFFKLGGKIIYPRDGVILWLKENKHESSEKTYHNKGSV